MKKSMLIIAIGALLCIPQLGAMEKKQLETILSSEEATELRKAVADYKNNRSRDKAEQIINWYRNAYSNDPFVMAKINEKIKFDIRSQKPTNLSLQEAAELRKAVADYKNNRSRADAEKIINMYYIAYPHDPLVMTKMNEKTRFDMKSQLGSSFKQEQKGLEKSQIQEEEKTCCVCMEDQDLVPIPCKNEHDEVICKTCLEQIKNSTNSCPMCREPLIG